MENNLGQIDIYYLLAIIKSKLVLYVIIIIFLAELLLSNGPISSYNVPRVWNDLFKGLARSRRTSSVSDRSGFISADLPERCSIMIVACAENEQNHSTV